MVYSIVNTILSLTVACIISIRNIDAINVALHAQVRPDAAQIVGSVITTDGLKAALEKRFDVENVVVYYPSTYKGFTETAWDLIVIEGWFRSIHDFIHLSRNAFPDVKVVYFCLDGHYPPFDSLITFDLDGLLTNSLSVLNRYPVNIPKSLMLLAADSAVMRPYSIVSREFGAVFVGAGGAMLQLKPGLYKILIDAIPCGLRLHGFHWEHVPVLSDIALGPLPRYDLAEAYSSAHVVITAAIAAQDALGMVNNRVFEALACGAIVVSEYSSTLEQLLTSRKSLGLHGEMIQHDLVLFVNSTQSIQSIISRVMSETEHFNEVRRQGREFILARHTWQHRAVQLIDFYHQIKHNGVTIPSRRQASGSEFCATVPLACSRPNCPRLLWTVSSSLSEHADYMSLGNSQQGLRYHLCRQYNVDFVNESAFYSQFTNHSQTCSQSSTTGAVVNGISDVCNVNDTSAKLSLYDVIFVVSTAFGKLDNAVASLSPAQPVHGKDRLQKRMLYLLGVDLSLLRNYIQLQWRRWTVVGYDESAALKLAQNALRDHFQRAYDLIAYRSPFEVDLLRAAGVEFLDFRLQHVFGVDTADKPFPSAATAVVERKRTLFVCFQAARQLCTASKREQLILQQDNIRNVVDNDYALLLLGGKWSDWLDGDDIVTQGDLHNVVHVSDEGQWSDDAVGMIRQAAHIYIMHEGNEITVDKVRECVKTSGGNGNSISCTMSTVRDILWPIVAAAVSARDHQSRQEGSIHLFVANHHLLDTVGRGAMDWNSDYMLQSMRQVGDRLHGFGSVSSGLTVEQLVIQTSSNGGVACVNCNEKEDLQLLQSNYLTYFVRNSGDISNVGMVLLRMSYTSFVVGRDGECCVLQRGSGIGGDYRDEDDLDRKICLLRPFSYVLLNFIRRRSTFGGFMTTAAAAAADDYDLHSYSVDMSFSLRGNFYADTIYVVNSTFTSDQGLNSSMPVNLGRSKATIIDTNIFDQIYAYNVYL